MFSGKNLVGLDREGWALLLLIMLPSQKPPVVVIIGDAPPKRVAMPKYYGSAHNLGFRLGKMLRRG